MKQIYLTILILLTGLCSFSQYPIYTAIKSGVWNDMTNWAISYRTDGILKAKVVIPSSYIITADNNVNAMGLGSIDLTIGGTLVLVPNTNIALGTSSTVELIGGSITGSVSTQKIQFGSIVKYQGDLDNNKSGQWIADNLTGTSPLGFRSTSSLLAVKFTGITVNRETEKTVSIRWSAVIGINNNRFEVERSKDGRDWRKLAIIFPSFDNQGEENYEYTDDAEASGTWYYRIKQVDNDGAASYSAVKIIGDKAAKIDVKIFSYAGQSIKATFNKGMQKPVMIRVLNMNGQLIGKQQIAAGVMIFTFKVPGIMKGNYVVQLSDGDHWMKVQKVAL